MQSIKYYDHDNHQDTNHQNREINNTYNNQSRRKLNYSQSNTSINKDNNHDNTLLTNNTFNLKETPRRDVNHKL